jgi:hypothetical protein
MVRVEHDGEWAKAGPYRLVASRIATNSTQLLVSLLPLDDRASLESDLASATECEPQRAGFGRSRQTRKPAGDAGITVRGHWVARPEVSGGCSARSSGSRMGSLIDRGMNDAAR